MIVIYHLPIFSSANVQLILPVRFLFIFTLHPHFSLSCHYILLFLQVPYYLKQLSTFPFSFQRCVLTFSWFERCFTGWSQSIHCILLFIFSLLYCVPITFMRIQIHGLFEWLTRSAPLGFSKKSTFIFIITTCSFFLPHIIVFLFIRFQSFIFWIFSLIFLFVLCSFMCYYFLNMSLLEIIYFCKI